MLTCWLIARGALGTMADRGDPEAQVLLDAMSNMKEAIIKVKAHVLERGAALSLRMQDPGAEICCCSLTQLFYNDKESTCLPKDLISKCKGERQLEDLMKKAFDVPASKPVKLYFKPAGEQEKSFFVDDFIEEQLEMAVAVYMDDE